MTLSLCQIQPVLVCIYGNNLCRCIKLCAEHGTKACGTGTAFGTAPCLIWISLEQIVVSVTFTMASLSSRICCTGRSSIPIRPFPRYTTAFIFYSPASVISEMSCSLHNSLQAAPAYSVHRDICSYTVRSEGSPQSFSFSPAIPGKAIPPEAHAWASDSFSHSY